MMMHICISEMGHISSLMAWCQLSTKPLYEPKQIYGHLNPQEQTFTVKFQSKYKYMYFLLEGIAFENVTGKISAILFGPQYIKLLVVLCMCHLALMS